MELKIDIATDNSCNIAVTDLTEYVDESSTVIYHGKFKRSQVCLVDVLRNNKTTEEVLKSTTYTMDGDSVIIPVSFDGWFSVIHLAIPTTEWLLSMLDEMDGGLCDIYDTIYYTDGQLIYKYIGDDEGVEAPIEEVIEINTENTTLSRTESDLVSICYMRTCYVNYCKLILNNKAFTACFNTDNTDTETRYKRDLVHMAISVISYLVECNQLVEAERIIETIDGCNGLCPADETSNSNGCGCAN